MNLNVNESFPAPVRTNKLRLNDLRPIVSPTSIAIASFLGTPLAGAILYSFNVCRSRKKSDIENVLMALIIGMWATLLLLATSAMAGLTAVFPAISLIMAAIVYGVGHEFLKDEMKRRKLAAVRPLTMWVVAPAVTVSIATCYGLNLCVGVITG